VVVRVEGLFMLNPFTALVTMGSKEDVVEWKAAKPCCYLDFGRSVVTNGSGFLTTGDKREIG
jgi:hypothetical protein